MTEPAVSSASAGDSCEAQAWRETQRAEALDACMVAASKVVRALPRVKSALAEVESSANEDAGIHSGGIGPMENDDGRVTVGLGLNTPERFEARVWYDVDRKTGALTVTVDGQDEAVPPEAQKAVAGACRE